MNNIIAMITSITALIVAISAFFKSLVEAKQNLLPKRMQNQSDINMVIIKMLEEAKERFRADRIQIYDYQNGEHFMNGRSAYKLSCTYEVVRADVKSYQLQLQKIPLLCIPKFHHKLLNKGSLYVRHIEDIKNEMPSTYELKKSQGIESFYDISLNNDEGEPIGFLGIQYNDDLYEITEDDKKSIQLLKTQIEKELSKMVNKK